MVRTGRTPARCSNRPARCRRTGWSHSLGTSLRRRRAAPLLLEHAGEAIRSARPKQIALSGPAGFLGSRVLDAILDAFYPGLEGGNAVAGALFGDFSPAGRSPVTFYKSTADLPPLGAMGWYPNATAGTRGISYRYFEGEPLFPFGFGLSCKRGCTRHRRGS